MGRYYSFKESVKDDKMRRFVEVARIDEIAPGKAKMVEVEGKKIAIFNLEGDFYAIDDTCPHARGPLSKGEVKGEVVTCPWHGSEFNIKAGEVLRPPARRGVKSYGVQVEGSIIKIEV
jgi:nitrite reductase/ring-hydroxylating ferredoxin subunit